MLILEKLYYIITGFIIEFMHVDIIHPEYGILCHYSNRCYFEKFPLSLKRSFFTISYEDIGRYCYIYA